MKLAGYGISYTRGVDFSLWCRGNGGVWALWGDQMCELSINLLYSTLSQPFLL